MNLGSLRVPSSISPAATIGHLKIKVATRSARIHQMVRNHIWIVLFSLGFITSAAVWGFERVTTSQSSGGSSISSSLSSSPFFGDPSPMMMKTRMASSDFQPASTFTSTSHGAADMVADAMEMAGPTGDVPSYTTMDMSSTNRETLNVEGTIGSTILQALQSSEQKGTGDGLYERLLINEGSVELQCVASNMDALAERISAHAALKAKGYVESRTKRHDPIWNNHGSYVKSWYIHIQLRIANSMFHDMIRDIRNMVSDDPQGLVSLSTSTRDVTEQYIDSTARASTIQKSRQALELLLNQATTVSDVLQVQRELTYMTQEIESHTKRAISLKKASDMSLLSITIREMTQDDLNSKQSVVWDPIQTVSRAVYQMKLVLCFLGDVLIYAVLWSVPLFVLMFLLSFLSRKPSVVMD